VITNPSEIDRSVGCRLRDKRVLRGWSHEQLAEKAQMDAKDLSAYEWGAKRISADHLLRLAKVLRVRPAYFFGLEEEESAFHKASAYATLPEQGLRLHRAFASVKNAALREAIITLVVELAKNDQPVEHSS
jgi:transcriptional regulator with XRE-family HTH domain